MEGTQGAPILVSSDLRVFPKGYGTCQRVRWFLGEVAELLQKHNPSRVAIRGFEGRSRDSAFEERVQHEAMIYLGAAQAGMTDVSRKVQSQIAKDFGLKGRARYLKGMDTTALSGFDALHQKTKDAVLAAWCSLQP